MIKLLKNPIKFLDSFISSIADYYASLEIYEEFKKRDIKEEEYYKKAGLEKYLIFILWNPKRPLFKDSLNYYFFKKEKLENNPVFDYFPTN